MVKTILKDENCLNCHEALTGETIIAGGDCFDKKKKKYGAEMPSDENALVLTLQHP